MRFHVWPFIRRGFGALRTGWLIVGITVAMLLTLELAYRAQGAVRRALRGDAGAPNRLLNPNHPNAKETWWLEVVRRSGFEGGGLRYDPFRGWWPRAERSRYMNIDSSGRRVTVQPALQAPARLVYVFGGSSIWGWIVRDSFTVPSLVAARLHSMGYSDVEVVNLAQSTFDLAQNAATLMQEIRHDRIPAVAVFIDGNNEMAPAFQSGEMGRILNQSLIARRFERRDDLTSHLATLLQHSALAARLTQRPGGEMVGERPGLCDAIAGSYARQTRAIAALSREFRFEVLFFWQPTLAMSKKPLTKWEREVASQKEWREMVRHCTTAVDSMMARERTIPFEAMHSLFDRESTSVFTDDYGHVTERANAVIADLISGRIAGRLSRHSIARR